MSVFEYVTVMMSVVLALGVARVLSFFGAIASGKRHFSLSWLHLVWVFLIFAQHVVAWRTIWSMRDVLMFSVGRVVMMLLATSLIFVAARILIPEEPTEGRLDLRDHYFDVRVPFFSMLVALWIFPLTGIVVFGTFTLSEPTVYYRLIWLGLAAVGLLVRRPAIHWVLAGGWFALLIAWFRLPGIGFTGS